MEITAQSVKDLRERTGLPMMECKQALGECKGDVKEAIEWLRKKHKGKLSEREGRATGEGWIGVYIDDSRKFGALIELQCETAPVAKNEIFQALANAFARKVAKGPAKCPDPGALRQDPEMDAHFTEVFGKLREAMNLTQCRRVEGGYVAAYVHHDGKSGVLLALDAKQTPESVGVDLAQHAMFTKPLATMREGIPASEIEKVRATAAAVAESEGKNASITEKIVQGKINAFCAENALLEQEHVKPDYEKKRVKDVLKAAGVSQVTDMAFMIVGGS